MDIDSVKAIYADTAVSVRYDQLMTNIGLLHLLTEIVGCGLS